MLRAMHTSATGMNAMQHYIDNLSNNLANVNTTAFKKNRMAFQDLYYQSIIEPGQKTAENMENPSGLQVGNGVRAVGNQKIFTMGSIEQTGNELDMMILEKGVGSVSFFQVQMPDGTLAYTRAGGFQLSQDGTIVTGNGNILEPEIIIPEGFFNIEITSDGLVYALLQNEDEPEEIGQIELARFVNPAGLKALGSNLFTKTVASGEPIIDSPGENGFGNIMQKALETSNVNIVEEMVKMIQAQRAYELNSKGIQTAEDMLTIVNNLKR